MGEAVRMHHDEGAELFGLCEERREFRSDSSLPATLVRISTPFNPIFMTQSSSFAASRLLQRHRAEAHEAIRPARAEFRDAVIGDPRGLLGDLERHRVIVLHRRRRDDLDVDGHGVEVGQPVLVVDDLADVVFLLHIDRLAFAASAKCASGIVVISTCGATNFAASGTSTWAWMSMVTLCGRTSRPVLPCCVRRSGRTYSIARSSVSLENSFAAAGKA